MAFGTTAAGDSGVTTDSGVTADSGVKSASGGFVACTPDQPAGRPEDQPVGPQVGPPADQRADQLPPPPPPRRVHRNGTATQPLARNARFAELRFCPCGMTSPELTGTMSRVSPEWAFSALRLIVCARNVFPVKTVAWQMVIFLSSGVPHRQ